MKQRNLEFESFNDRIHTQRVQFIFVAIVLCSYRITEGNVIEVASVAHWSSADNKTRKEARKESKKVAHGVYLCDYFLHNLKNYVLFYLSLPIIYKQS